MNKRNDNLTSKNILYRKKNYLKKTVRILITKFTLQNKEKQQKKIQRLFFNQIIIFNKVFVP